MHDNQSAPDDAQILGTAAVPENAEGQLPTDVTAAAFGKSPTVTRDEVTASTTAPPVPPVTAGALASQPTTVMRAVKDLKPHEENAKTYGDKESVNDLCKSIGKENTGILEPLLITKDGRIISGHRRYRAAVKLELVEVPVRIFESEDEIEILNALLEHNRHRIKTKDQIAAEVTLRLRIEKELRDRRSKDSKSGGKVEKLPPAKLGKARDAAGREAGVSGRSAEKGAKVHPVIVKLESEGKTEEAAELRTLLKKGFDTAYKAAVEKGYIPRPKPKTNANRNPSKARLGTTATPPTTQPTISVNTSESSDEQLTIPSAVPAVPPAAAEPPQPVRPKTTDLDSDAALTMADRILTFLRSEGAKSLTTGQKRDWGNLFNQLYAYRKILGF